MTCSARLSVVPVLLLVQAAFTPHLDVASGQTMPAGAAPAPAGLLRPDGEAPLVAVAEGVDPSGILTVRELVPAVQFSPATPDGNREPISYQPRIVYRRAPLSQVEVVNHQGKPLTDLDELKRRFAAPCMILLAPTPNGPGIDPEYVGLVRAGVMIVRLPESDDAEPTPLGVMPPTLAYVERVKPPVFARGGVVPRLGRIQGLSPDGMMLFEERRSKSIMWKSLESQERVEVEVDGQKRTEFRTVMKSVAADGQILKGMIPYPAAEVRLYDVEARPWPEASVRERLAQAGPVLLAQEGVPTDPAYLIAARPGTCLVVLPVSRSQVPEAPAAPVKEAPRESSPVRSAEFYDQPHIEVSFWGPEAANFTNDELQRLDKSMLRRLDMNETNVTNEGLHALTGLAKLERLSLAGSLITDAGLAALTGLDGLKVLHLRTNRRISGAGLASMGSLPALETLSLDRTGVSDQDLPVLAAFPSLTSLGLSHTSITDEGLVRLPHLAGLKSLYLEGTNVTDEGAMAFSASHPECRVSLGFKHDFKAGAPLSGP